jgi:hypothetical protein
LRRLRGSFQSTQILSGSLNKILQTGAELTSFIGGFSQNITARDLLVKRNSSLPLYTNVIIIEVKLEEGHGGDAFMQLCRYFDIIIRQNPRYCETGAPTFLITISGMSDMLILMTFGLISL